MTLRFNKITDVVVIAIFLSAILIMTGSLFSFNLLEWNLQHEQLKKITELTSNPQTSLEEQRQLFADVRHVLENQEKILQKQNLTAANTTTKK